MGFLAGKRALIVGVATERSIAWGIAQAMHREGAELAFTYVNDKMKERVEPLAESLGSKLTMPLDVTQDGQIDGAFDLAEARVGPARHSHPRGRLRAARGDSAASSTTVARGLSYRARRFELQLHRARPRRAPADDGPHRRAADACPISARCARSRATTSWVWPRRVSKPTCAFWPPISGRKGIRVNGISAGPIKTLAAAGIAGFRKMLGPRCGSRAAAPQRHARGCRQRRGVPVLGPRGRHHRRDSVRRQRVQYGWNEFRGARTGINVRW